MTQGLVVIWSKEVGRKEEGEFVSIKGAYSPYDQRRLSMLLVSVQFRNNHVVVSRSRLLRQVAALVNESLASVLDWV